MKTAHHMLPLVVATCLGAFAALTYADNTVPPKNAPFEDECSSCHLAYPPAMLDANSWRALMNGLPRHFATDASLDERRRAAIADFLVANAGGRKTGATIDGAGRSLLRISETSRFLRKHHEISAATWKRPAIKSAANCTACHPRAAACDFEEENVRIPR